MSERLDKMHGVEVSECEVATHLGFSGVEEFRAWQEFCERNLEYHTVVDIGAILRENNDWDGRIENAATLEEAVEVALFALGDKPSFLPEVRRAVNHIYQYKPYLRQRAHRAEMPIVEVGLISTDGPYQPRPAGGKYARHDLWAIHLEFDREVPNRYGLLMKGDHYLPLNAIPRLKVNDKELTPWDQTQQLSLSYRMGVDVCQLPITPSEMVQWLFANQPLKLIFP